MKFISTTRGHHCYSYRGKRDRKPKTHIKISSAVVFMITFILATVLFINLSAQAKYKNEATKITGYYPETAFHPNLATDELAQDFKKSIRVEPVLPKSDLEIDSTNTEEELIEVSSTATFNDPPPELNPQEIVQECLGSEIINAGGSTFTMYDLPSKYYPDLDFSSFQAWMPYTVITDRSSAAYKVISDERMYVDENGMCRFETTEDQFTIDGKDDYVIALGTYYKPKGTCGDRWLVVTSTGSYTAITGDEKADCHTDDMNMFTMMDNGKCAGIIEWLVDYSALNRDIKYHGTVTRGPVEELQGEILFIYRIN